MTQSGQHTLHRDRGLVDGKEPLPSHLDTKKSTQVWLTLFVFGNPQIGLTEGRVLRDLHPDAEHLFNLTTSLKTVCDQLNDPNTRLRRTVR